MAMVRECRGWDRETPLRAEGKPSRQLFPDLPERARFNRRRRNLLVALHHIRHMVVES
jgi:hypothetical protein